MSWIPLTLLSAFFLAATDALTKRYFSHLSPYEMGLSRLIYSSPFLLGTFIAVPWVPPDNTFYLCIALALPLEAAAHYGYMTAIKISPLSLTLPFLAFTPVFALFTGWLLLREFPTNGAILGIGLIVTGAYCLNLSAAKFSYLEPFKAIVRERGSIVMLFVSLIYAFTSVLGKMAVLHSNVYIFSAVYFISFTAIQIAALPVIPAADVGRATQKPLIGLLTGASFALMIICHSLAITRVDAANMVAVKRTSMLFGVIFGWLWFSEKKMNERLLGVGLMLFGILIIGWLS